MPTQDAHTTALAYSHLVLQKLYPAYVRCSVSAWLTKLYILITWLWFWSRTDGSHGRGVDHNPPPLAAKHFHFRIPRRSFPLDVCVISVKSASLVTILNNKRRNPPPISSLQSPSRPVTLRVQRRHPRCSCVRGEEGNQGWSRGFSCVGRVCED
jgi:hypothetical protein